MLLQHKKFNRTTIRKQLRKWQYSRSWARLICEAEKLWKVEPKELKKMGAFELNHLLNEVPKEYKKKVYYWLMKFSIYKKL
tara:strand:+ start:160 stop:402 length:243 start_codon:yes stop_codon:yes gene_type:complete